MVFGKLDTHWQKIIYIIGPSTYTIFKNQLKFKDLNTRSETIKLFEETIGKELQEIELGNDVWDMTWKTQTTKAKLDKWDYLKLKSVCTVEKQNNS